MCTLMTMMCTLAVTLEFRDVMYLLTWYYKMLGIKFYISIDWYISDLAI